MKARVVAWNVAHQENSRPIPPDFATALLRLEPDVIVLTEFVPAERPGRERRPFYNALETAGMKHLLPDYPDVISRNGTRKHTLIASRFGMERGDLRANATDLPGPTGFLHVRFPNEGFEVAGVRVPCFKQPDQMMRFWEWFTNTLAQVKDRSMVTVGDLNLNVRQPKPRYKAKYVQKIESDWQIPDPSGEGSFVSKTGKWHNIDYGIVSKDLRVANSEYVTTRSGYTFASPQCDMSDHAVFLIDVEVGQSA